MESEQERELDDRWVLGLRGLPIESVTFNEHNVVVAFGEGAALTIKGLAEPQLEQSAVSFSNDDPAAATDALTFLAGSRVLSGVAFKTGALRVVLDTGAKLRVPTKARFEAWQLLGPSGRVWVSLPGGGLASVPSTRLRSQLAVDPCPTMPQFEYVDHRDPSGSEWVVRLPDGVEDACIDTARLEVSQRLVDASESLTRHDD